MNEAQRKALAELCERYGVAFDPANFGPTYGLPSGYVAGWIGSNIYVGVDQDGRVSS